MLTEAQAAADTHAIEGDAVACHRKHALATERRRIVVTDEGGEACAPAVTIAGQMVDNLGG